MSRTLGESQENKHRDGRDANKEVIWPCGTADRVAWQTEWHKNDRQVGKPANWQGSKQRNKIDLWQPCP